MRVSLKFRERVAAVSQAVLDELEQLASAINIGWAVEHNLDGTHKYGTVAAAGSGVPAGAILGYSGATLPSGGWLWCDGAEYAPAAQPGIYAVHGTTWNTGGETLGYFRVPNGAKRMLIGADTGFAVGTTGGAFDHTHTGPAHTHTGAAHTHTGPSHTHAVTVETEAAHTHAFGDTTDGPSGTTNVGPDGTAVASGDHTHAVNGTTGAGSAHGHTASTAADGTGSTSSEGTGTTSSSGTGASGTNNPPYFVGNWIIKT